MRRSRERRSDVQEALELAGAHGVLELAHRLRLDLPYPLSRDLEDLPDLFERVRVPVADAVAELDDFPLTVREGLEDLLDPVLERGR